MPRAARAGVLACAALALVATIPAHSDAEGRFGGAIDTLESVAVVDHLPAHDAVPLTVEMWVRLRDRDHYNILIANGLKSSPTHWELFTWPGDGCLTAYLPGCQPDHCRTDVPVCDDEWHYVAMVLEAKQVRLYVDGEEASHTPITRDPAAQPVAGPAVIGSLVARELGCNGLIDEVRLSSSARDIVGLPGGPFAADADTIGLWHFDEADSPEGWPDASGAGRTAARAAAVVTMDRVDVTRMTPEEAAEWDKAHLQLGGPSLAIAPPPVDVPALRASLAEALADLRLPTLAGAGSTRDAVLADWEEQYYRLDLRLKGQERLPAGAAEQVYDRHALVFPDDGDPLGVVLRRTRALVDDLGRAGPMVPLGRDLDALAARAARVPVRDATRRKGYYLAACALQRRIALANPLLDFDSILFVARGVYKGSRVTGPTSTADVYGQHFNTQYFGFNSIPGGGLFIVRNFRGDPVVENLLADSVVESGRLAGRRLEPGAFLSPDLSYDGRRVLFSYTENRQHRWIWSPETAFHIFSVDVDGSNLRQLTDGEWDDFDACWLPGGRVAFISERRGGYIRCFALLHVRSHVLHSMEADGTDIAPLSFYETSEWHPSVNNDGMLVYTRWDYTDRENCLGSNFWICTPDGRDPRAPHGNYPYPWHTFEDNTHGDSRDGRPYTEMSIRAVPNSHRYIATAAPHHGEAFGSLVMLDLRERDDGNMSQLRRITPYEPFPETESAARSQYAYGTAWPLSEDYYLCNWWENLYLLDRFGNQVLLCENALVFGGETNYDMRLIDPIPLKPRPRPPIVAPGTEPMADHPATVALLNVYDSDLPLPPGTTIKWLRITQNILKPNPWMGVPMIGYQNENTPRIPLGIVPVEADGSAYFEAPPGKELIFQALDENHMAVQSMRSVAFVHPGEHLTCIGCHEDPQRSPTASGTPRALMRAPSRPQPEIGPIEPVSYYRTVKPVFERSCIPCHQREGKGPIDMSYSALEPYAFYFAGGMSRQTVLPTHGGSRTIPGRFGARNSRLGRALLDQTHRGRVPPEDVLRVVLWLDSNSPRLGAFTDEERQQRGELVWPELDVNPTDPLGLGDTRVRRAGEES